MCPLGRNYSWILFADITLNSDKTAVLQEKELDVFENKYLTILLTQPSIFDPE